MLLWKCISVCFQAPLFLREPKEPWSCCSTSTAGLQPPEARRCWAAGHSSPSQHIQPLARPSVSGAFSDPHSQNTEGGCIWQLKVDSPLLPQFWPSTSEQVRFSLWSVVHLQVFTLMFLLSSSLFFFIYLKYCWQDDDDWGEHYWYCSSALQYTLLSIDGAMSSLIYCFLCQGLAQCSVWLFDIILWQGWAIIGAEFTSNITLVQNNRALHLFSCYVSFWQHDCAVVSIVTSHQEGLGLKSRLLPFCVEFAHTRSLCACVGFFLALWFPDNWSWVWVVVCLSGCLT